MLVNARQLPPPPQTSPDSVVGTLMVYQRNQKPWPDKPEYQLPNPGSGRGRGRGRGGQKSGLERLDNILVPIGTLSRRKGGVVT
jgi:hypothetical protein